MKKIRKQVALMILGITVLFLASLSGCISEESKFIGTWLDDTGEITIFHEDGTTTSILDDLQGTGTWKLENDRLVITFGGFILTFDYSFSNNDKTLTITNIELNKTYVMTKQ